MVGMGDGGGGRLTLLARVMADGSADVEEEEADPGVSVTMGEMLLVPAGSYVYVSSRRSPCRHSGAGVGRPAASWGGVVGDGKTCC